MVEATLIHSNKFFIKHSILDIEAVVELKIWEFPRTEKYPLGIRYSLFCIDKVHGRVLVGFDNHFPKGPHKHVLDDFFQAIRNEGYEL